MVVADRVTNDYRKAPEKKKHSPPAPSRSYVDKKYINNPANKDKRNIAASQMASIVPYLLPGIGQVLSAKDVIDYSMRGDLGNAGLSALGAIPGAGVAAKLAAGASKVKATAAGKEALDLTMSAMHRSSDPLLSLPGKVFHPSQIPVSSGRTYGPGTYLAQNEKLSDTVFSNFGDNKFSLKPSGSMRKKILEGKGYLNEEQLAQKMGSSVEEANQALGRMGWDDPFVQKLMQEGYIGYKHGDAATNWLLGAEKGLKLKANNPNYEQIVKYYADRLSNTAKYLPLNSKKAARSLLSKAKKIGKKEAVYEQVAPPMLRGGQ